MFKKPESDYEKFFAAEKKKRNKHAPKNETTIEKNKRLANASNVAIFLDFFEQ